MSSISPPFPKAEGPARPCSVEPGHLEGGQRGAGPRSPLAASPAPKRRDSAFPRAEREERAPHLPAQVRRGRGGVGSKCPGSGRGPGASVGWQRSRAGRGNRLTRPARGASSFWATSLTRPGRPHTSSRPPPQRPVRPHSRPCPQRQRRPENPGQRSGGQSARVPGGEVDLGGRRGGGERPGERPTRLPGTEARGQRPSNT